MPQLTAPKNIPRTALSASTISSFLGVDMSSAPANVKENRSPAAPNMIRETKGKVRKRTGYELIETRTGRINGVHFLDEHKLIHAGSGYYLGDKLLYTGSDARSVAFQMNGAIPATGGNADETPYRQNSRLWILDGKELLCFGLFPCEEEEASGETPPAEDTPAGYTWAIKRASEIAYTPTILIARAPTGGGTSYEKVNLLSPRRTEKFCGVASVKTYQLSAASLDEAAVTAKKRVGSTWQELSEGTDFTVNRTTGLVTFTVAPGVPPVTGEDNVAITYHKTVPGYRERIDHCQIGVLYGVSGATDRLFVSGNPAYPNYDWYSALNDPTYFGDMWYSILGQDSASVVGYSIVSDRLAAHRDRGDNNANVILREGVLQEGEAAFPQVGTLQGTGAIAPYSFCYLQTEPLFLTREGIYAITANDIIGEKYAQHRSFFIKDALMREQGLQDAFAFVYDGFYMLALNGHVYILDGTQYSFEGKEPYSTRQYECYYWTNIPARVMWEEDGALYFGTGDGKICRFFRDYSALSSYNDCGEAIPCYWQLPDFDGRSFYKNKTVRYLAIRLASAAATGVMMRAQIRGGWQTLKTDFASAGYCDLIGFDFTRANLSGDTTPKTIGQKVRLKKVDKVTFRFENSEKNEPFGIYEIAIEFTEGGNYKGE